MNVIGFTDAGLIRVIFDGSEAVSFVPDDMENADRQKIAAWEAAGNVIPPYVSPPQVLGPLTARQLRLGLVMNGYAIEQVEAAIDAIENPQDRAVAKIEWEYASTFNRTHPLIAQVGTVLGLTSETIDAMWEAALTL
ncbi:hypothetical protein [Rhizobium sp. LC145]|uniref:hypothetical protein n=1 Tax=Rhizobium sp. LC145 TaxID=1120688 RepID=UPI0006997473|nr:hypothetical protein [Rhizobium sp. LC145]TKT46179.1 hypothetical protein FDR95_23770 [Rhizobiaceae bacterium LC148]